MGKTTVLDDPQIPPVTCSGGPRSLPIEEGEPNPRLIKPRCLRHDRTRVCVKETARGGWCVMPPTLSLKADVDSSKYSAWSRVSGGRRQCAEGTSSSPLSSVQCKVEDRDEEVFSEGLGVGGRQRCQACSLLINLDRFSLFVMRGHERFHIGKAHLPPRLSSATVPIDNSIGGQLLVARRGVWTQQVCQSKCKGGWSCDGLHLCEFFDSAMCFNYFRKEEAEVEEVASSITYQTGHSRSDDVTTSPNRTPQMSAPEEAVVLRRSGVEGPPVTVGEVGVDRLVVVVAVVDYGHWVGGPRDIDRLLLFSPVLDWLELAES
ncbi:hypothetical protein EYF80_013190 [Liparis tanakae]|uniref:Uncharacterized protein n=1 Tax=Liparis tanakae TaxID=230148 RepID=A0A4Z2IF58_9TELE|nr:hypothetical protein EYF80_013190 [Liparis tanakae]